MFSEESVGKPDSFVAISLTQGLIVVEILQDTPRNTGQCVYSMGPPTIALLNTPHREPN